MASLKQKNNWLVYRDKLDEEENHEGKWGTTYFTALTWTCRENHGGNWDTTYFTALTQMCWENREPKESGSRTGKVRALT